MLVTNYVAGGMEDLEFWMCFMEDLDVLLPVHPE